MSGKWHLDGHPLKRGFERYYGLLTGTSNHFNPGRRRPGEPEPGKKFAGDDQPFSIEGKVVRPYTPQDRRFYSTDAFTDHAIGYLEQHGREKRPFFLYLAYTVPHYPLHAWPEDIARYRGRFMSGWDTLRRERHRRLVREGLISGRSELSPRSPHAPAWDEVADKEAWDLKMAVYAAMVDRMDQNIGRLMETVRSAGQGKEHPGSVPVRQRRQRRGPDPDTRPAAGSRRVLPIGGPPLGQSQQHAVSAVQALEPRRRHRHAPGGVLAPGDRAAGTGQFGTRPPHRHHGHLPGGCRSGLSVRGERDEDPAARGPEPASHLPGKDPGGP